MEPSSIIPSKLPGEVEPQFHLPGKSRTRFHHPTILLGKLEPQLVYVYVPLSALSPVVSVSCLTMMMQTAQVVDQHPTFCRSLNRLPSYSPARENSYQRCRGRHCVPFPKIWNQVSTHCTHYYKGVMFKCLYNACLCKLIRDYTCLLNLSLCQLITGLSLSLGHSPAHRRTTGHSQRH